MGDYYYNEKKGRYEPVREAPFGIKPREKSSKKVFTADSYNYKTQEPTAREKTSNIDETRYRSITDPVEKVVNRLVDALEDAAESKDQTQSPFTPPRSKTTSSSSSGNDAAKTQKAKAIGYIVAMIFIINMIRSCFN